MPVVAHLLPSGSDIALLSEHLDVRAGRASSSTATFYDTFDGRLHADGVALRHEGGTLALLDRVTEQEVATGPGTAARRLFDHDLPDAVRERLADVIEMRALTPVARVQTRRTPVAVLNSDAKTVVRLSVEEHPPLQTRLRATAVRGYDNDLERVLDVLAGLELQPATVPLVDEAIVARGGTPAGTSAKINVALDPEAPATTAAAAIFTRLVEVIGENLPGTLDDVDSEFLHDLRVAVRRSRSLQRQFAAVYPPRLQHFRDEFKRLQAETGDLRDLDVYLLDFDELRAMLPEQMRADLLPLRDLLTARRGRALTATRRALKSKRTEDTLAEWLTFVHSVPPAAQTVRDLASHRISRVYRKMVKMGTAIDDDSPAEDLHELRKVGKELRYLLEFFAGLYPAEVIKPFVKSLKSLQDQLGRFQDREVQANTLRTLAPDVAEPFTVMAMGVLVDRFIKEEAAARAGSSPSASPRLLPTSSAPSSRSTSREPRPRHLQHQGRRRQDLGGGQPRDARRPRRRTRRCCGTSTRRAPAPSCSASSPRSRAAAGSSCAARPRPTARSRAPTPRAWTCCRRTSPTATWTSRSTAPRPTASTA